MPRYVAFLRAINVGGRVVKMERLRALFAELGLARVETLIASGNIIFETKARSAQALETKIEKHLAASLGYDVTTFLRDSAEVAEAAAYGAFPDSETRVDGAVVYIAFLKHVPTKEAAATLARHENPVDSFRIREREIHWLCRKRFSESEFSGARLEKILGQRMTVRNSTTVRKLAAKFAA